LRRATFALLAAASPIGALPASALPIAGTGLTLSGNATLVSDYRYRGVSQSMGDPAPQAGLGLRDDSGVYAGVWASYVKFYDDQQGDRSNGIDTEFDLYAGWSGEIASRTALDVGMVYYAFPGMNGDTDLAEATVSLTRTLGPSEVKIGAAYDWDQKASPDDMLYLYGEAMVPIARTRFYGPDYRFACDYWDWSLGGEARFGRFTATLSYVNTDLRHFRDGGAGVVASIGIDF
jgi:uncharacterized protein (TIGR02001 family)